MNLTGKKSIAHVLLWPALVMCIGCRTTAQSSPEPMSAGTLVRQYRESSTAVRGNYDGKEISVRGYAQIPHRLAGYESTEAVVLIHEDKGLAGQSVACWFSKQNSAAFRKLMSGQSVTVKGIFNGEAGAELKFCTLVEFE